MYTDNRIEYIVIDADAQTVSFKPVADPGVFGKAGIADQQTLQEYIGEVFEEDEMQLTDDSRLTVRGSLQNIARLGDIRGCLEKYLR